MNGAIWDSRFRRVLYRVVVGIIVFLALVLVGLLAGASANTEFFDRYFTLLFKVNLVVGALLVLTVGALAMTLWVRYRRGKFGTRLMTKLAVFFGVVGVLPGVLIYLVSLQFVSRSIESWFDVRVETALEAGLNLGRSTIDSQLADLQSKARLMADQLTGSSGMATSLQLNRLREQYGVQEAAIFTGSGRVMATASSSYASLVPDLPSGMLAEQARLAGGYAAVEGGTEPSVDGKRTGPIDSTHLYRIRVIIPLGPAPSQNSTDAEAQAAAVAAAAAVQRAQRPPRAGMSAPGARWAGSGLSVERRPEDAPATGFGLMGDTVREERYLQVLHPVPAVLARNADEVQRAYQEYQEKALGRTGLRKMYIGTLTLTLFLAVFIAVMLALLLGGQLARPLLMLLQGTKEVAEGDLSPKRELKSRDELGMLTQQFNAMTRQLSEARIAVEENRTALGAVEGLPGKRAAEPDRRRAGVRPALCAADRQPRRRAHLPPALRRRAGPAGRADSRAGRVHRDRAPGVFRAEHQRGAGRRAALAEADRTAAGRRGTAARRCWCAAPTCRAAAATSPATWWFSTIFPM